MVAVHDGHGSFAIDEETDLALLDQHLLKTNTLSKRMTTILSRLDTRLSRLDKTIGPLGIKDMSQLQANIDAALGTLEPARPSTVRQESYGSTLNGVAPSIAPSISSMDSGIPARKEPNNAMTNSVMDRTRAIPRPDTLPRWTDASSRISQVSTARSPIDSPQSARSQPAVTSPLPVPSGGERAILNRGIDPMSVGEYYGAIGAVVQDIEQMQAGIDQGRGGQREAGVSELCTILEDSFAKAAELLLKTVKDTLPRTFDPGQYASNTPSLSTYYPPYTTIRPLSAPLAQLAYPEEPTSRSTQVVGPIMDDLVVDIAAIRGEWLRRSFSSLAARVDEADGSVWEGRGSEKVRLCMKMWDTFLTVCESEATLSSTLMPGVTGQQLAIKTLSYPLQTLTQTTGNILQGIKRKLSAQTMTMLDLYASMLTFQPRYDGSTASWLPEGKEIQGALSGPINVLRGLALRSFPERLVDIRAPSRSNASSSIADTTYNTLSYLEALPTFGNLVENLLRSSGHVERAWLMGASAPPSTAKSAASEGGLLNLYAADVLGTLLQHLEAQAKASRRPVGSTFLVNNVSHIRNMIASFKDDMIGPGAEDMLNRSFREAKATYTAEWKALTQTLHHTAQSRFNVPGTSHDKQSTKEASAAFFDKLGEMESVCRQFPLNRQDPELRDRIGRDVEELVKMSYSAFWNKAHSKGFDKYLRATPEEVGQRVRNVFR